MLLDSKKIRCPERGWGFESPALRLGPFDADKCELAREAPPLSGLFAFGLRRLLGDIRDAHQSLLDSFGARAGRAVARADVFSATAARMRALKAVAWILSPS